MILVCMGKAAPLFPAIELYECIMSVESGLLEAGTDEWWLDFLRDAFCILL